MKWLILIFAVILKWSILTTYAQAVIYPNGNTSKTSSHYTASVSSVPTPVLETDAGSCPTNKCGTDANSKASFTIFSLSGTRSVTVTKVGSTSTSCTIRPSSLGIGTITASVIGGNSTVTFPITGANKVQCEWDDDPNFTNTMVVFAQPAETSPPDTTSSLVFMATDSSSLRSIPGGKTIVYFRSGKYKFGRWTIPSAITSVYLAGGSYLEGYFYKTSNPIAVSGRGIISGTEYGWHYPGGSDFSGWYPHLNFITGNAISIDGITIIDATGPQILIAGTTKSITYVNEIGFYYNQDGITLNSAGSSLIDHCYDMMHEDWCVYYTSNVTNTNNIGFTRSGSNNQFGYIPHNLSNFTFDHNTILHDLGSNPLSNVGYASAQNTSISSSPVTVSNIVFSNLTFETPIIRFIDFRANKNVSQVQPITYTGFTFNNNTFAQGVSDVDPFMYFNGQPGNLSQYPVFSNMLMNGVYAQPGDYNNPLYFNYEYLTGAIPPVGGPMIKRRFSGIKPIH